MFHFINQKIESKKKRDKPRSKIMYQLERPGVESYRKTREDLTTMDKLHMALTELCYSINYSTTINVWEYTFAPREYLNQHLETRFARALSGTLATVDFDTLMKRITGIRT